MVVKEILYSYNVNFSIIGTVYQITDTFLNYMYLTKTEIEKKDKKYHITSINVNYTRYLCS
jgi:hypothetical protein